MIFGTRHQQRRLGMDGGAGRAGELKDDSFPLERRPRNNEYLISGMGDEPVVTSETYYLNALLVWYDAYAFAPVHIIDPGLPGPRSVSGGQVSTAWAQLHIVYGTGNTQSIETRAAVPGRSALLQFHVGATILAGSPTDQEPGVSARTEYWTRLGARFRSFARISKM